MFTTAEALLCPAAFSSVTPYNYGVILAAWIFLSLKFAEYPTSDDA